MTQVKAYRLNVDTIESLQDVKVLLGGLNLITYSNVRDFEILKKYFQKAISLETMVILDMILGYVKKFDKKLTDPVWETVSLRIRKYQPFLNIDIAKYKEVLKEIVL